MSGRLTLVSFAALFALAVVPLLSTPIPPLFDYPNHLGRMAILAAHGQDPVLNRFYTIRWGILPNLGMDVVVPWLAMFMPVIAAGRVFLVGTLLLMALGPVLLYRAWWRTWSPWSCTGFLFLYSRVFLWGFINYLAGVGLALCMLAGWVLLQRRSWLLRGSAGAIGATLVFFCHLEAFGILALMLLGVEAPDIVRAARGRNFAVLGARAGALVLALLPASLLFLLAWQPHAVAALTLPRLDRKPDLLFSVFDNYSRPFDVICFVIFLGAAITAYARGSLRMAAPAAWSFLLLSLIYLLLPSTLFTGEGADHRLPLVLFLLLAAATKPQGLSRRQVTVLASALTALFVVRIAVIETVWRTAGDIYRQDLASLAELPSGARVAVAAPASAVRVSAAPEYHFPVLAVLLRQAFVPTLFAFPTQQPVGLVPVWRELAAQSDPDRVWRAFSESDAENRAFRDLIFAHYDFLAVVGGLPPGIGPGRCLFAMRTMGSLALYRLGSRADGCNN